MADQLFDWCVETIKSLCLITGLTYNEMNIFLFCIMTPIVIIYYMVLSVLNTKYHTKTMKRITWVSIILTITFVWVSLLLVI